MHRKMKAMMPAALTACLVAMTGAAGAEGSAEQSVGAPAAGVPATDTPATGTPSGAGVPATATPGAGVSSTDTPATGTPASGMPGAGMPDGPKEITLDAAAQARLGITLATLKGAATPTETASTGRVLDPGRLLQLDSELGAAAASFTAARAESLRLRKLYSEERTSANRAGAEAASAHAESDLERVNAAHRQLAMEWGSAVANLQAHKRADLLNELSHSHAELARVEVPEGAPIPRVGSSIQVRANSAADLVSGAVLGTLPAADPGVPTRGVLVELKGEAARLPIGQMLSAEVLGPEVAGSDGVILPRASLLRRDGRVWAYVQTAPTTFVRREVDDFRPAISGWFVAKGFAPGDRVVATGGVALLGVESPAAADTH